MGPCAYKKMSVMEGFGFDSARKIKYQWQGKIIIIEKI